tara:strand:+ start:9318 stop:10055 length:738 start_codon:yes stop_codon:yes gene_type:complete
MCSSDIRLAKLIADRGFCSRRNAEAYIIAGRVKVNGKIHIDLGKKVTPDSDVSIDNTPLEKKVVGRLWAFHKPIEMICSHLDPEGRQTVFSYLKKTFPYLPHVISVGRLDYMSEGLLLITNKGSLAHQLEKPNKSMIRTYDVKLARTLTDPMLKLLEKGVSIDGIHYKKIIVQKLEQVGSQNWYRFKLTEGKNREIRKILEHFKIPLARLKRVAYGPIKLGPLEKGAIRELKQSELKTLLEKVND